MKKKHYHKKITHSTKRDVVTLFACHWVFLTYITTSTHTLLKIIFPFSYVSVKLYHTTHTTQGKGNIAMAQTMLLMSSVSSTYSVPLNKDPLLQLQCQRLKPRFSDISFSPLSSNSKSFSSRTFKTLALFKSKTKAPAKVRILVLTYFFYIIKCNIFIILSFIWFHDVYFIFRLCQNKNQRLKMVSLELLEDLVSLNRTNSLLVVLLWSVLLWVNLISISYTVIHEN